MSYLVYFKDGEFLRKDYDYDNLCFDEYSRLSKEGYNVVAKGSGRVLVNIAKNITLEDYELFKANVRFLSSEDEDNMKITNHVMRNGFDDVDEFSYSDISYLAEQNKHIFSFKKYQAILKNRKSKKVLDMFLRKKLNMLTKEEEEMYHRYEDFDLDTLVFGDDVELDTLNTDNCGVISIFDDCTYKSNNTIDGHYNNLEKHCRWYEKTHGIKCSNDLHIYIFKDTTIFFIPEIMNSYQVEELEKIVLELEDLCRFHNKKITVDGERTRGDHEVFESYASMDDIKELIEREKDNESVNHI